MPTRTFTVAVTIHDGTYPDPGALAAQIQRTLTDPRHGLSVIDVTVRERNPK